MLQRIFLTTALFSAFSMSQAELADLTESELSDVSGEGIALVFEDFQIEMKGEAMGGETGNNFKITGIKDSSANDVTVSIGQYYLSGTGSNLGTALDGKLVNLGRTVTPLVRVQAAGPINQCWPLLCLLRLQPPMVMIVPLQALTWVQAPVLVAQITQIQMAFTVNALIWVTALIANLPIQLKTLI